MVWQTDREYDKRTLFFCHPSWPEDLGYKSKAQACCLVGEAARSSLYAAAGLALNAQYGRKLESLHIIDQYKYIERAMLFDIMVFPL